VQFLFQVCGRGTISIKTSIISILKAKGLNFRVDSPPPRNLNERPHTSTDMPSLWQFAPHNLKCWKHIEQIKVCLRKGNGKYNVNILHNVYASVNSSGTHPPPGNCGAFVSLVSPGVGHWQIWRGPGAGHLPNRRAFDTHGVSNSKSKHGGFYARNEVGPAVLADWLVRQSWGLDKLVEVFLILCISALLIKAQLELSLHLARSGTINVNRRTHASDQGFK